MDHSEFSYELDDEKLREYATLSFEEKLEWLEAAAEFTERAREARKNGPLLRGNTQRP